MLAAFQLSFTLPLPLVKIVVLLRLLQINFDQRKDFAISGQRLISRCPLTSDTVHLHDFAGKRVYLNFWKMTNGLCLRDLAHVKELMRTLEGRNIVFTNIALDENEGAWCELVAAKKLPNVHLRLAGGLRAAPAQPTPRRTCPRICWLAKTAPSSIPSLNA